MYMFKTRNYSASSICLLLIKNLPWKKKQLLGLESAGKQSQLFRGLHRRTTRPPGQL